MTLGYAMQIVEMYWKSIKFLPLWLLVTPVKIFGLYI